MGKRKRYESDSDEERHWKKRYHRLERKIRKKKSRKHHRRRSSSSSSDSSSSSSSRSGESRRYTGSSTDECFDIYQKSYRSRSSTRNRSEDKSPRRTSERQKSTGPSPNNRSINKSPTNKGARLPQGSNITNDTPQSVVKDKSAEVQAEEVSKLDPELSELLGKRLDPDVPLGPAINDNIAIRWIEVITKGLPKEEQKELIKKYSTPENCKEINPPLLNSEIKASIPEGAMKRDVRMVEKQTKLAICLSALGQALNSLVIPKKDESLQPEAKVSCLGFVSDACRLLLEVQREESSTRKALVLMNLNPSLKDALYQAKIDEFLFGSDLDNIIKASKSLEKTSKDLKTGTKPAKTETPKNEKRPHRSQQQRPRQRTSGQRKPWQQDRSSHRKPYTRSSSRRDSSYSRKK